MDLVQFPGLWHLQLHVNSVAFKVFGLEIYWYGIIIAIGFFLAVLLAMRNSKKFGFESENIIDLVLFAAPVAVIMARLYYVVFSWDQFNGDIGKIVNIREGGLAIYGGIIGAFLTAWIFTRYKKIKTLSLFDFAVPYFALAQAIGRWGNFMNQEAFGTNTKLPWGMTSERVVNYLANNQRALADKGITVDFNVPVHPTFIYESLLNIAIFAILIWFRKRKKVDGEVFFLYLIMYGIGRACIEALRTDSLMWGSFRVSQALSILVAILSVFFIIKGRKSHKLADEPIEIGSSQYGDVLKRLSELEDKEANAESDEADLADESVKGDMDISTDGENIDSEAADTDNYAEATDSKTENIDNFVDNTDSKLEM